MVGIASTMESKANAGPASAATGREPAATFPAVLATETIREHYNVRIKVLIAPEVGG